MKPTVVLWTCVVLLLGAVAGVAGVAGVASLAGATDPAAPPQPPGALALRPNPAFESFGYAAPANWRLESYTFPLPWSPRLPYHGIEDVLFVPAFTDRTAPGYHALVWIWWLDGHPAIDAGTLGATLLEYFRGLSTERGNNNHFTPQLDRVKAAVSAAPPGGTAQPGAPVGVAPDAYRGQVTTYNAQGELITLQVDVEAPHCPDADHTALLFRLATRPRTEPIWSDLGAVSGSFRCHRD
jgi:hypothetical protein